MNDRETFFDRIRKGLPCKILLADREALETLNEVCPLRKLHAVGLLVSASDARGNACLKFLGLPPDNLIEVMGGEDHGVA